MENPNGHFINQPFFEASHKSIFEVKQTLS